MSGGALRGLSSLCAAQLDALGNYVAPAAAPVHQLALTGVQAVRARLLASAATLDAQLHSVPPSRVLLASLFLAALVFKLFDCLDYGRTAVRRAGGLRPATFAALRALPGISTLVKAEQARMLRKLRTKEAKQEGPPPLTALPLLGTSAQEVVDLALDLAVNDTPWTPGESRMSGCVYMQDVEHFALLNRVYARFAHSNPLHADIFPACARMEREVVAMTASMLGGGARGATSVCGCVTSGGTESILTALRTTRDFMRSTRGIWDAEIVVAESAHAAVYKAASYFNLRLVRVPVDKLTLQMDVLATRRAVTRNTVLIYASAPGFPHGVVDDVQALAEVAQSAGCGLHVDACLGGFVLPFAKKAGWRHGVGLGRPFDFSVAGVTSMSVDTHKYGLAQKGSSVLLYANPELRRAQYTAVTEWSGGLYISPSAAGSRPGGLIAQTWASLVHMGESGFVAAAQRVLEAADTLAAGVRTIPGLQVLGQHTMVVAFRSQEPGVNIFQVNDELTSRGWHLNALQRPAALHFCVTPANSDAVPALLRELRAAVDAVRAAKGKAAPGGMAPVYGLAGGLPDRGAVGDLLKGVQDIMLDG